MAKTINIAGVLIRDKRGRYLLVQERKISAHGLWGFPGGHVDEGETLQSAAIRETHEEVNLEIKLTRQEPIYSESKPDGSLSYYAFGGKVTAGSLKIDKEELLDAQWLTISQIEALDEAGKIRDPWIMNALLEAEDYENSGH